MYYELYVDRMFFFHFILNIILLSLTAATAGLRTGWRKLTAAAGVGAIVFLAVFLWPLGESIVAGVIKTALQIAGTLLTLQLTFGFSKIRALLRAGLFWGTAACVLAGVLAAAKAQGSDGMGKILLPAIAVGAVGSCLARREWQNKKRRKYIVRLCEGEESIEILALADSGNSLCDPISGRPVCVTEREVVKRLGLLDKPERFRMIPFHSVGKEHGWMEAWAVETMYIQTEGQKLSRKRVLLAVSEEKLSRRENYQLLLHPILLEEKKGENQNHDIESGNAGQDAV